MDHTAFTDVHWMLDIIQSTNLGIVVLDQEMRVQVFNRFMQVHSGVEASLIVGERIGDVFPELPLAWLERRVGTVMDLAIPVYTTWEERPWLFSFALTLPIQTELEQMYQNVMFVPLRSPQGTVERVGLVIYDVTEIALAQRKLQDAQVTLLKVSRTDRLTSLWGRGYWEERLQEELRRGQRSNSTASLVMLDIDHFKQVNDRYGHPVGDEVIRMVARTLHGCARDIDICGRYGGEEFAVILPETNAEGGLVFCERLRKRVEQETAAAGEQMLRVTISLGIAELNAQLGDAKEWISLADQALYRAKAAGRNRTCISR